ncbi:transglycosylase family protein [Pseudonocardia lacus]|uniref:transglycosylase family protein n=1 Tax=Pseudonocardia lacus TaxID=2835865 RepID=UPI001BDCDFED|nr:transglycosylase family protein [Pseudonocardia lacus]
MGIGWRGVAGGAAVVLATVFGLPAVGPSSAGADPSADDWATLRACESSGRYDVVATHGHYGAYQFDIPTWKSVGGTGLPSDASPAEQDYRALYLYRMRGWQPWECARMRHLVPDADARSKRVPTRAEARYMAPDAPREVRDVHPPSHGVPRWPGVVFAFGDCDPALRVWQLRMGERGYPLTGTGCYRERTRAAVLDIQRRYGINPSGRLGPQTWRAAWTEP